MRCVCVGSHSAWMIVLFNINTETQTERHHIINHIAGDIWAGTTALPRLALRRRFSSTQNPSLEFVCFRWLAPHLCAHKHTNKTICWLYTYHLAHGQRLHCLIRAGADKRKVNTEAHLNWNMNGYGTKLQMRNVNLCVFLLFISTHSISVCVCFHWNG